MYIVLHLGSPNVVGIVNKQVLYNVLIIIIIYHNIHNY